MGFDAAVTACRATFVILAPVHEILAMFSNSSLIIRRRKGDRADGDSEISLWKERRGEECGCEMGDGR